MHYTYPTRYAEIKEYIQRFKPSHITHTYLETKFNLTLERSKLIVEALQREGLIDLDGDNRGRYKVRIDRL